MSQEEKELLLKDLCGRLVYGVRMKGVNEDFELSTSTPPERLSYVLNSVDFKPYLRPMSSMTNSEVVERNILFYSGPECKYQLNDWLDEHMFDYRGLIPMGLALEATEDMYSN